MSETTYNGWKNYETWRVNLEVIDGYSFEDIGLVDTDDIYSAAEQIQSFVHDVVLYSGETEEGSYAQSYARAFLESVDWRQIAKAKIEEHQNEDIES